MFSLYAVVERFYGRVTRLWMDGFRSEEALLQEAGHPVLVYQQASEVRNYKHCRPALQPLKIVSNVI